GAALAGAELIVLLGLLARPAPEAPAPEPAPALRLTEVVLDDGNALYVMDNIPAEGKQGEGRPAADEDGAAAGDARGLRARGATRGIFPGTPAARRAPPFYPMLPPLFRPPAPPADRPRRLVVLGSTGSIGTQAPEVAAPFPDRPAVAALAAGANWEALAAQARRFRPEAVCVADEAARAPLTEALAGTGVRVLCGQGGMCEVAALEGADVVLAAVVGAAGLRPTLAAVEAGRAVALA